MVVLFLFITGLCVGSFLNVLIDRLPLDEGVVGGRSHCDHCRRTLAWYELVPVLSYALQGGKSGCCHRPLSPQYPLVETATGLLYAGGCVWLTAHGVDVYSVTGIASLVSVLVTLSALMVIFVTDLKTERIPTVMLVLSGIGTLAYLLVSGTGLGVFAWRHLLPSALTGLFFFALWYFSKGRAMGDGDISLSAVLALFTGFPGTVVGLYAAFLTGAAAGVILMIGRRKSLKSHIAFGPFLIAGFVFANVFATKVLDLWRVL